MLKLRGRRIPAVKKISVPSSAGFLEPETGAWHPVIGTTLESSSSMNLLISVCRIISRYAL
jgi:hypothetical protein